MQPIIFPHEPAQMVLNAINKSLAPCTVFVFGYRSQTASGSSLFSATTVNPAIGHHFDLLVFSNKAVPGHASNIANAIAEQSNKTITATILLHKVTDLATKQPGQQWFFDRVLRFGQRLCLDKTAPPFLLANTIPSKDREGDTAFWLKCVAVAQFNIQAAKESPQLGVELCKIALLNTACVQIALGLIRIHMGYTPNEFGLNYLLQLCKSSPPDSGGVSRCNRDGVVGHSREGGNREQDVQQINCLSRVGGSLKRYKMLCTPPSMLNHWTKLHASEQDFQCILEASEEFLNLASCSEAVLSLVSQQSIQQINCHSCPLELQSIDCHSREGGNP